MCHCNKTQASRHRGRVESAPVAAVSAVAGFEPSINLGGLLCSSCTCLFMHTGNVGFTYYSQCCMESIQHVQRWKYVELGDVLAMR